MSGLLGTLPFFRCHYGTPGMHKGKQKGEGNNNYVNGIGMYRKRKLTGHGRLVSCSKCRRRIQKSVAVIDHINRNRASNQSSNHRIMCKSCHQTVTPNKGRFKQGNKAGKR